MKWTSKDKKSSLDLSKIAYWDYSTKEDAQEYNKEIKNKFKILEDGDFYPLIEERNELKIYIGGHEPIIFYDENAVEVYKMLISQKEVL